MELTFGRSLGDDGPLLPFLKIFLQTGEKGD